MSVLLEGLDDTSERLLSRVPHLDRVVAAILARSWARRLIGGLAVVGALAALFWFNVKARRQERRDRRPLMGEDFLTEFAIDHDKHKEG